MPFDDVLAEPDETVILTLRPNDNYRLGNSTNATITISEQADK